MTPPHRLFALSLIFLFETHLTTGELVLVNQLSVQNGFGEDFSQLIRNSLVTDQELVKNVLFSQEELEISINYGTGGSEVLCQGLKWSESFCPVSSSLSLSRVEDEITFNERVGDHVCSFMTNDEFNCLLTISDSQLKVQKRTNSAQTLLEVSLFPCESSSEICFAERETEVPALEPRNCTKAHSLSQKVFPVAITVGNEAFSSILESSFAKTLSFIEEELTKANMFLLALFRVRIQLTGLAIEENRASELCSLEAFAQEEAVNSSFELLIDSCGENREIASTGGLCDSAKAAFSLSSLTTDPFPELLQSLIGVFSASECSNDLENCLAKGLVSIEAATCGNGAVEEGEECECAQNETECDCCRNCMLRRDAICDAVNNECCADTCEFKTVESFCQVEGGSGYCRLGQCQQSGCQSLGYEDFCGLHEDNACKTKCEVLNNNACLVIDANNANLFVRDGTLCELEGQEVLGNCQTGECVVIAIKESSEPLLSTSNFHLILGFTGFVTILGIFLVLLPRRSSNSTSLAHYEGPKIQVQQSRPPEVSNTPNPTFGTNSPQREREVPPLPQKNALSRSSRRKQKPKQISVVQTPHRSSKKWAKDWGEDYEKRVRAVIDDESTLTDESSPSLRTNQSTLKRLSARSKKPPPGLGWQVSAPGPGDVFAYVKEEA